MFKIIYIKAAMSLIGYSIISKAVFVASIVQASFARSLILPALFGMTASCIFLYIFGHDDYSAFARALEKREERKEKAWLRSMKHVGKISATLLIGTLAGPILSALTARILLPHYKLKYPLVVFISIPSTIFSVAMAKGLISFFS